MVQPVAASPSCIQSYSPCSLISDLIQRIADCAAAIFNAIAGLFNSCFGQETTPPVIPAVAAPARPIPSPTLQPTAAPARPTSTPPFNPVQMIGSARELQSNVFDAIVANGARFLTHELQVLKQTDRPFYEKILTTMESHPHAGYALAPFIAYYLISAPSLDGSNAQLLSLRERFAALSDRERAVVLEDIKTGAVWSRNSTNVTRDVVDGAKTFALAAGMTEVFSACAQMARHELVTAREMIDPNQLMAEGTQFLMHEYEHTEARNHQGLFGQFNANPGECFNRVIVYHLVFPTNIVRPSDPAKTFINHLMQTRAAQSLIAEIEEQNRAFNAFSAEEQRNALAAWRDGAPPTEATEAFHYSLVSLQRQSLSYDLQILYPSALSAKNQLGIE